MAGRIRPAACKLPTLDIKPPRNHKCTRDISPPSWEPHRIKWKRRKQRRSTSVTTVTTPQEFAGGHRRPISSLLKGLIWRKNKTARGINEKKQIKQCSDGEQSLQIDIMHRLHAKRVFLVHKKRDFAS